jgi:pimeloyl-ACP methyl ester carboxylesterase
MKTWQDIKDHTRFFTTNDGVQLAYATFGDENAHPIIFVGGYFSTMATWVSQIDFFETAGYRVILFDRRNHGQSDVVDYGMTIYRHAEDLHQLIEGLGYDRVSVVGHSQGAATISAYLMLFADEKLDHVVLLDQSPKAINDETWDYGLKDLNWDNIVTRGDQIKSIKMSVLKIPTEVKRVLGASYERQFDFDLTKQLLRDTLVQDFRTGLRRISIPVLLLGAEKSPLFPWQQVFETQQLNSDHIQAVVVPEVGHLLHIEAAEVVNDHIVKFLHR